MKKEELMHELQDRNAEIKRLANANMKVHDENSQLKKDIRFQIDRLETRLNEIKAICNSHIESTFQDIRNVLDDDGMAKVVTIEENVAINKLLKFIAQKANT